MKPNIDLSIRFFFELLRKMIRRMLESSMNAEALGEVLVEEADDGRTALQALESAAGSDKVDHNGNRKGDTGKEIDLEEGGPRHKGTQEGFDLVFIDYIMTTMNGPEAVQIMRKDLKFTGGIIGVTGNALPADLTYFKECGADLVITKPLTNKKLMDAVHSVTQMKKSNNLT